MGEETGIAEEGETRLGEWRVAEIWEEKRRDGDRRKWGARDMETEGQDTVGERWGGRQKERARKKTREDRDRNKGRSSEEGRERRRTGEKQSDMFLPGRGKGPHTCVSGARQP